MARPDFFAVRYVINPWMNPRIPVDHALALAQWSRLRDVLVGLGHTVLLAEPIRGLPDMVYTANAGLVIDGTALVARFAHPERTPEEDAFAHWFTTAGLTVRRAVAVNEGEGDHLLMGSRILAAHGQRTVAEAHVEVAAWSGLPVVTLELVSPWFYHLDTALAVLADDDIAYHPPAFTAASQEVLRTLFPDAVLASTADARVLGLNVISDGHQVVMTDAAPVFAAVLRERGYDVTTVAFSELLKGGGSVKCCVLEIRR